MQPSKLKDDRWCFACGSQNPHGLHLDDIHLDDQECVCTFTPAKSHQGWADILHGGITSTLLDEIMTHLLWRRGYDAMTAEMTVRFRRPIPIGGPLTVRARITRLRSKLAETQGEVLAEDGAPAAAASAKYIVSQRGPDRPGDRITLAARRAVIFDMFGTLVPVFNRSEYFEVLADVADALGMNVEQFTTLFRADAPGRTTGQFPDLAENLASIARRAGLQPSPERIARATAIRVDYTRRQLMNPYPDAVETLKALRDAGRPVGLISDCSPEAPTLWPDCPLAALIPEPVFSCEVALRKPDPRIYTLGCERWGMDPSRAVYVGDGDSRELPGALDVGLCPVLIDRGETSAFRVDERTDAEIVLHDLTQLLPLIGLERPAA